MHPLVTTTDSVISCPLMPSCPLVPCSKPLLGFALSFKLAGWVSPTCQRCSMCQAACQVLHTHYLILNVPRMMRGGFIHMSVFPTSHFHLL